MPFVRLLRAAAWLARIDRQIFLMFLLISPMYFLGSCFWSAGFFKGARSSGIHS